MWCGCIRKWLRKPAQRRRVIQAAIRLAHRIESAQWDDWLEATSLVNVVNDLLEEESMATGDPPSNTGDLHYTGDSIPGVVGTVPCPFCGRCPTCGRSDWGGYPDQYYPQYPAYSRITCTTAAAY